MQEQQTKREKTREREREASVVTSQSEAREGQLVAGPTDTEQELVPDRLAAPSVGVARRRVGPGHIMSYMSGVSALAAIVGKCLPRAFSLSVITLHPRCQVWWASLVMRSRCPPACPRLVTARGRRCTLARSFHSRSSSAVAGSVRGTAA